MLDYDDLNANALLGNWSLDHSLGLTKGNEYRWALLAFIVLYFSFPFTYIITTLQAKTSLENRGDKETPPTAPYWTPVLGHLVLFLVDLNSLLSSVAERFGHYGPIRLRLFTKEAFLVTGPENLRLVWRNSQWLTAKAGHIIGLSTILDTPKRSMAFYEADDSGIGKQPLLHSNVPPEHRVWHLTHQPIVDCLSGSNLRIFTENFKTRMASRIERNEIGEEWIEMSDLYTFVHDEMMHVQLELLCGTFFLEQNPNFVQDFRRFHHAMIHLKKGFPKWLTPGSCRARNICLASMKKWHEALKVHDPDRLVDTGEIQNPRFGNEIMRSRRRIMAKMDVMDEDTAASADLGMLWALNANPVTATFWLLYEILRDPSLQPAVKHEIKNALLPSLPITKTREPNLAAPPAPPSPTIDHLSTSHLTSSPLLQSLYVETLRLRVSVLIIQSAEFGPFKFKEWLLPKDKLILISSRLAHMDKHVWNTGSRGEWPVEKFWAERFLVWEGEEGGGPLKKTKKPVQQIGKAREENEKREGCQTPLPSAPAPEMESKARRDCDPERYRSARFSTANLAGIWVPYGGGPGICPGRHFAKSNMLLATAMLFSAFEMELVGIGGSKREPQVDLRYYGLGVLPPRGEVRFRIRKRRRGR